MIDLSQPEIAQFFGEAPGAGWFCQKTKATLDGAILEFYRLFGGNALYGLTYLGLPLANAVAVPGVDGIMLQRFERGVLVYDPLHALDTPPGGGSVYLAYLHQGPGQDPRLHDAMEQIKALQVQLIHAQSSTPQLNDYKTRLNQINNLSRL